MYNKSQLKIAIQQMLDDGLLKKGYASGAHCYIASEAYYHLMGGKAAGLKPMNIKHEGAQHWFILADNEVIDLTSDQFKVPVNYNIARGRGFLTKQPSKRANILINKIKELYK